MHDRHCRTAARWSLFPGALLAATLAVGCHAGGTPRGAATAAMAAGAPALDPAAGEAPDGTGGLDENAPLQEHITELMAKGNTQGALAILARITAQNPTDGLAWYMTGQAQLAAHDTAAAFASYQKADRYTSDANMKMGIEEMLVTLCPEAGDKAKCAAGYQELKQNMAAAGGGAPAMPAPDAGQVFLKAPPFQPSHPEVSPATLAVLTQRVHRAWRGDAVPTSLDVASNEVTAGEVTDRSLTVHYYSASARAGLYVFVEANGTTSHTESASASGTVALPDNFLALSAAMQKVGMHPAAGSLRDATLQWMGSDITDPANLQWKITDARSGDAIQVPAGVLSRAAINQLVAAAQGGDAKAQYDLAEAYRIGLNGPSNAAQSLAWLRRSAASGDARADNRLGQFYQFGFGVPADPRTAAGWYLAGARKGYAPAQFNLGVLYENGVGVAQSWSSARHWLGLAAQQGADQAIAELGYVEIRQDRVTLQRERNRAVQRAEQSQRSASALVKCPPWALYFSGWGCVNKMAFIPLRN